MTETAIGTMIGGIAMLVFVPLIFRLYRLESQRAKLLRLLREETLPSMPKH
jgi:hypothetical protein